MPKKQFEYHIHISLLNSYIYFENPKVACSTIKATLQEIETKTAGKPPLSKELAIIHNKKKSPLLSPADLGLQQFSQMLIDPSVFKFCFVRNPYTKLLSAFLSKISWQSKHKEDIVKILGLNLEDNVSFEDFVKAVSLQNNLDMDPHWRVQTNQLFWGVVKYDFIGRFENFNRDFLEVISRLNLQPEHRVEPIAIEGNIGPGMAGKKTSAGSRLANFYTEDIRQLTHNIYQQDFMIFNYDSQLPI
jgi:hypothetical protein